MKRLVVGLMRAFLLYALVCASLEGVVRGVDALRSLMEINFEDRYGYEVVDREPPFSWRERLIVSLDIQPSMYWQESAGMSALAGIPISIGLLGAAVFQFRSRRAFLMLVGIGLSSLMLYMLYQATHSEQWNIAFVGYVVGSADSALVAGLLAGLIQGVVVSRLFNERKAKNLSTLVDLSNGMGHSSLEGEAGTTQTFDHRAKESEGGGDDD